MERRINTETPPDQSRALSVTADPRDPRQLCQGGPTVTLSALHLLATMLRLKYEKANHHN
jgi:hypothetical protein